MNFLYFGKKLLRFHILVHIRYKKQTIVLSSVLFLKFFTLITAFSRLSIHTYSRRISRAFTIYLEDSGAEDAYIVIQLFLKATYF